jgi:molybdate transport system substrate-binding protein
MPWILTALLAAISRALVTGIRATLSSIGVAAGLVIIASSPASSAELTIFGSRVTKMIVEDIGPQFERATGHRLVVITDVAAVMKRRIEAGEPFDLAVLVDFQADELIRKGKLAADARSDIMKAGIGVAVRRGAQMPDISTVEAFRQTLLAAKSITYLKEGASTIHLDRLFARMGISESLQAKTVKPATESVSEAVAAGDVELGIIVIPNILSVPGAQLVGPIPEDIQSYIVFTAAVAANSPNPQAARDFIAFLRSPAAISAIKAKGMSPG